MATKPKRTAKTLRVARGRTSGRLNRFEDTLVDAVSRELQKSEAVMMSAEDHIAQTIVTAIKVAGRPLTIAEIKTTTGMDMSRMIFWLAHMSLSGQLARLATADGRYTYAIPPVRVQPLIERHAEALAHLVALSKSHPGIARMVDAACDSFENLKGALT